MKDVLEVVGAVERAEMRAHDPLVYTVSTGIVFRIRPVSPLLIRDIGQRVRAPVPPKAKIEDKDAWEENPNDPEYQRALSEYQETVGEATNAVLLSRGTAVVSVPDGYETVEGNDWAEEVEELAGIKVPAHGARRYYCWVKYVALVTVEDFSGLLGAVTRAAGVVTEREVARELESFSGVSEGDADTGVHATPQNGRGHTDSADDAGLRA